jgi:hypothetical protein
VTRPTTENAPLEREALSEMSVSPTTRALSFTRAERGQGKATTPPGRRELWITDAVLLAPNLSPLAKLLTGAISRAYGSVSYQELEQQLPTTRPKIRPAIAELEAAGLVTLIRPKYRKPGTPEWSRPNYYKLAPEAWPYGAKVSPFTRFRPWPGIGQSAARWLLGVLYTREQNMTGAVQIPDALAARLIGTTQVAIRSARADWKLPCPHPRANGTLAAYTVPSEAYPPDLERFDPTRRKLATVSAGPVTAQVWATHAQLRLIRHRLDAAGDQAAARTLRAALDLTPSPLTADAILDVPNIWILHAALTPDFVAERYPRGD